MSSLYGLLYDIVIYPLLFILPAYFANSVPVLFTGWGPLDKGRKLAGKRIFGDNKTVRGTLSAIVAGSLIGFLESALLGYSYMFYVAIFMSVGAVLGDLLGSFIKRRLSMKPGSELPLMDQYGFFVFAMLLSLPFGNLPGLYGIVFLVLFTGVIHRLSNILAYMLKLKEVPW